MSTPKCNNGNDGWVCAQATGGNGTLSYSWNTGATSNCLYNLVAGTYTVKVSDANGCFVTSVFVLANPAPVVVTTSSTNISCNNANNGTATAVGSGGTAPYTYTWSNGVKNATITGLCAGTYTVTVKDSKGCKGYGSVTITNPSAITAVKTMANPKCKNGTDGWICVAASGGTGALTYSWNTGATSSCIYGLGAGTYTVKVTDSKGCNISYTVCLTNPNPICITKNVCNVTYCNGNNGSICVSATGGTGALTYSWSTGATTNCISCLPAGNYIVWVKDSKGCTASMCITVNQPYWCGGCRIAAPTAEGELEMESIVKEDLLSFDAFPNPFVESSTIAFSSQSDAVVRVEVFNLKGEFIQTLFSGNVLANEKHTAQLNGTELAQGVYLCKITSQNESKFIKVILQK